MRSLLYLIGVPGVGKTSTLRGALMDITGQAVTSSVPQFIIYPGGAQLGIAREQFGGTDAYDMAVQPKAIDWLRDCPFPAVVAEGDRLGNPKFFSAALRAKWELSICWVDAPLDVTAKRRRGRGSNQSESWLRGRITKIDNLVEAWGDRVWRLDANRPLIEVVRELKAHPTIAAIRGTI